MPSAYVPGLSAPDRDTAATQIRRLGARHRPPERLAAERRDERRRAASRRSRRRVGARGQRRELVVAARLGHQRLRGVVERLRHDGVDALRVVAACSRRAGASRAGTFVLGVIRGAEQRLHRGVVLGVGHAPDARRQQHRAARHADARAVRARAVAGPVAAAAVGVVLITSTHALPHSICPAAEQPQTPPLHTDPAGHALPHAPQLSALFMTCHARAARARGLAAAAARLAGVAAAHLRPRHTRRCSCRSGSRRTDTQAPLHASRPARALALSRLAGLAAAAGVAAGAAVLLIGVEVLALRSALRLAGAAAPNASASSAPLEVPLVPPWPGPMISPRPAQLASATTRTDQSNKLCRGKAILRTATIGRASVTRQ